MTLRALFLDCDGVVAPFSSTYRTRAQALDGRLVRRVARFVEQHDLTVVLASTWRYEVGLGATVQLLAAAGWPQAPQRMQFVTPVLLNATRGEEISAWLAAVDNVEAFVIFDDADPGDLAPVAAYQVVVNNRVGLTAEDVVTAAAVLRRQRGVKLPPPKD